MHIAPLNIPGRVLGPDMARRLKGGCVVLAPGEAVGSHVTDAREEALVVLSGEATVSYEGEADSLVPTGHLAFIPENVRHDVRNNGTETLTYVYLVARLGA